MVHPRQRQHIRDDSILPVLLPARRADNAPGMDTHESEERGPPDLGVNCQLVEEGAGEGVEAFGARRYLIYFFKHLYDIYLSW